jgi:hypothetical protein
MFGGSIVTFSRRREEAVANPNFAITQVFEACNHTQSSGFAAAGRTEHGEAFAFADFDIQVIYSGNITEFFSNVN